MNFPASIDELQSKMIERGLALEAIDREIRKIEVMRLRIAEMVGILPLLIRGSWQSADPGKYMEAVFFLDASLQKRVVVYELLPVGTKICATREEWQAYRQTVPHLGTFDRVPFFYPVVDLKDVGTGECQSCKAQHPILETYVQIEDSPEGDLWRKRRFVFCLECNTQTHVDTQTSSSRFY